MNQCTTKLLKWAGSKGCKLRSNGRGRIATIGCYTCESNLLKAYMSLELAQQIGIVFLSQSTKEFETDHEKPDANA